MVPVGGGKAIDAGSTVKDYGGMTFPEYTRSNGEFQGRGMPLEPKSDKITDFAKTKEKGLPERVDESIESIMEEIRVNLEEQLVAVYESGDEQMFEEFVSSLTEEQIELLGLNEVFGDYAGDPSILSRASRQVYSNQQRQAAGQRTMSVGPAPATAARPSAAPTAARPSAAPAAGRPAPATAARSSAAPAPTAKPATPAPSPAARQSSAPAPTAKPATPGTEDDSSFNIPDVQQGSQYVYKKAEIPSVNQSGQNIGIQKTDPETGQPSSLRTNPETGDKYIPPEPKAPSNPSVMNRIRGFVGLNEQLCSDKTGIKESLESVIRSRYLKG